MCWRRSSAFSTSPAAAGAAAKGSLLTYRPGLANGRGFLVMAGAGFDAHVVANVSPRLKRLLGKGAYVLETLRQLGRFSFPRYRVTIDGTVHEAASVIVARGHFYGGRFVVAPEARLDRDELHVCLFRKGGRLQTILYAIALGCRAAAPLAPCGDREGAPDRDRRAARAIRSRAMAISSAGCRSSSSSLPIAIGLRRPV